MVIEVPSVGISGYSCTCAGVSYGTWYYEVHIDDLVTVKESTVRLGWSQSLGELVVLVRIMYVGTLALKESGMVSEPGGRAWFRV